ncbi:hypothetical protein Pmani_018983 [Petrolisthes manimaculis]|uniref:Proteasome assembly chaperone 2 n=1 Tax=Petrolisthes manimaculis TaxID=1843537 RepID=A0AAE1U4F2_9EUCA|nr:hypothetical protein Pmani_018983 [Petrolisthes manimaculis]
MVFFPVYNVLQQPDITGYTLIMPSVSVGNVGQLAVDLLINNTSCRKIGLIHHPALLPLVGGDPYSPSSKDVTTSADVHVASNLSLVFLQIRSPLIKGERLSLMKELCTWIKTVGIKEVVVLAACNAYERWSSDQLFGSQLRYLTSKLPETQLEALRNAGGMELEERTSENGTKHRFLSGAGFVKQFLDTCELPTTALFKFVDEGDNTIDAVALVNYLNAWKTFIKEKDPKWKFPFSWEKMFGEQALPSIY